jgi:UDP-glucose:(heptosyl)LPS alpha-1,3-glucosyltransferase
VVFECARFLAGREHQVTVYAAEWEECAASGITYHRIALPGAPSFMKPMLFHNACRTAVQSAGYQALGTHGCECPLDGVYWTHSVHRAWLEASKQFRSPLSASRIKQRLNPLHTVLLNLEARHLRSRRYKKVIALSSTVKADLMRWYGVPEADIRILPNGYSPEEFSAARSAALRDEMRARLGYAQDDRVIIFVANELQRKGFWPLVQAISALQDRRVQLLVVGRVSPTEHCDAIQKLGLAGQVKFAGPSSDIASFYAAADVFALPTQYEAWGLVIVEALACGLPVLTSRLAGAAVAVREGETGELIDRPLDSQEIASKLSLILDRTFKEDALTPEEIEASVAGYSWASVLERYETVLSDCFGQ